MKTLCDKNRHIDQWNRVENPEIDQHICGQLFFSKGAKVIKWENGYYSYLIPYPAINSK